MGYSLIEFSQLSGAVYGARRQMGSCFDSRAEGGKCARSMRCEDRDFLLL